MIVLGVGLEMFGEVGDAFRQDRDLHFRRAGVVLAGRVFGDDFYLEIQDHGSPEDRIVNVEMARISQELGIPLIATNDAHYLTSNDAEAHDALLCILTGKLVTDEKRLVQPYSNAAPEPVPIGDNFKQPFVPGCAPINLGTSRAFNRNAFQGGGGCMNGKALDIVRMLDAIRAGGAPILSKETTQQMMSNQVGPLRILFDPTGNTAFGFGGSILLDPAASGSALSPGSWQWGGVWGHSWFVDPTRKLTIVNLTNTTLEGMAGQLPGDVQRAAVAG